MTCNNDPNIARRRLGTTIRVRFPILTNGEETSLDGRDITILLVDPWNVATVMPHTVEEGNIVAFTYEGRDQRYTGAYRVEVYENYQGANQSVFDFKAFVLVQHSSDENDSEDGLSSPVIDIEAGSFEVGGRDGKNAYEIAVDNGFTGTVTEWLESLKGDAPDLTGYIHESEALSNIDIDNILNI